MKNTHLSGFDELAGFFVARRSDLVHVVDAGNRRLAHLVGGRQWKSARDKSLSLRTGALLRRWPEIKNEMLFAYDTAYWHHDDRVDKKPGRKRLGRRRPESYCDRAARVANSRPRRANGYYWRAALFSGTRGGCDRWPVARRPNKNTPLRRTVTR